MGAQQQGVYMYNLSTMYNMHITLHQKIMIMSNFLFLSLKVPDGHTLPRDDQQSTWAGENVEFTIGYKV